MITTPLWRSPRETRTIHLALLLAVVLVSVLVNIIVFHFFSHYALGVAAVPFIIVIPIVLVPALLGIVPGLLVSMILLTTNSLLQLRYQVGPQATSGVLLTLWLLAIVLTIGAGFTAHAIRRLNQAIVAYQLAQREAHHRIKNNLNLAASLLSLQADQLASPEGREALQKTHNHLRSIATVHDALTDATDAEEVDLHSHLHRLAAAIRPHQSTTPESALITVSGPTRRLPSKLAVSFGIILNELVTNAIKHGGGTKAHTHVAVLSADGTPRLRVEIKQPGIVLPDNYSFDTDTNGMGLWIVDQVVQQHRGSIRITSRTPAVFEMVLSCLR